MLIIGILCVCIGACRSERPRYYPLDSALWRYYAVAQTILDEHRRSRYFVVNAGRVQYNDESVYVQAAQIRSFDYLRYRGDGVERIARRRPPSSESQSEHPVHIVLPQSLEPGSGWSVLSSLGLIESRTFAPADRIIRRHYPVTIEKRIVGDDVSVEVPAGRFYNCLQVDGAGQTFVRTDRGNASAVVEITTREWYAPDIGLVRLERTESSPSTFLKSGQQTWQLLDHGD